jgi:outer membrane receptor for ferrienterochelin and colicins
MNAARLSILFAAALPALLLPAPTYAQATRTGTGAVAGRVIDAETGVPLASADVRLEDAPQAARSSDADGAWRITSVPAGAHRLTVRLLGYRLAQRVVVVAADSLMRLEIALTRTALPLDDIVVTAARRDQRLADVAVTTEVLSRAELERSGAADLSAVLTEHTGVDLHGGHPNGAGIMLQGIGAERVLVLIDGQPVAGRIAGVFDISRIPVAAVERVEIVKGPQSTLYGSEAMGGVVNVITRAPGHEPWSARVSAVAGSQGRRDAAAGVTLARHGLALGTDVNWRTIHNTPGRATDEGALAERTDALVQLRWTPTPRLRVEGSALALDERQRWRSGTLYAFADNRQWNSRVGASWRAGAHALTTTIAASWFEHVSRGSVAPKPIAGDTGQRQVQQIAKAEVLYNLGLDPPGVGVRAVDLGIEVEREATESDRVTGRERMLVSAEPFAQVEVGGTNWSVLPGIRLSWNEQWGTHLTPRVATRVRLGESLTLRASAGSGFRAPDFKELYMFFQNESANYAVIGNEDLRPETSRNVSAGLEWTGRRVYARGQVFHNAFHDFIETRVITDPGAPPVFQYANVDDGWTEGLELESGIQLRAVRAEAGVSYLATENRATGQPLLGRPTYGARLTLTAAPLAGLRASISSVYTGRTAMERDDVSGVVSSWRDAYLRTDLRVVRGLPFDMDVALGVDNVFDDRPAQWASFTGRHLYTSISWRAGSP